MPSVSGFLLDRMHNAGIKHIFGVSGDYVAGLFKEINDCKNIDLITTTDENHAGFAADAYARINGIGAVCVTYVVGALKTANAVACAYTERSPLIIISGAPGVKERQNGVLLHHMVRDFDCQKEIFDKITCASAVLDNPHTAGFEIDRVLSALQHCKQPIYIEIPRDMVCKTLTYDVYKQGTPKPPESDVENIDEAFREVGDWLSAAKKPVILAGVQLSRFGLGGDLLKFAERLNIPICTTLLSKSAINEKHPLFSGIYMGHASKPGVRELVEGSDCLLMLGTLLNDVSFATPKFKSKNTICCSVEALRVKTHTYTKVVFEDFCNRLFKSINSPKDKFWDYEKTEQKPFVPGEGRITVARLFEKINSILKKGMSIVADTGDSLFGAADIMCDKNYFLSPAFYASMGSAIPGALGIQLACPDTRVIALVGDGGFQMSCSELSTIVRHGFNPIIFVLNNGGYASERKVIDGPFNDLVNWNYEKVVEMLGGEGHIVRTERELEEKLSIALRSKKLSVLNILIEKGDISPALKRMVDGINEEQ